MSWFSTASLLALGLFFLTSVWPKVQKPGQFVTALEGYGLPKTVARFVGPVAIGVEGMAALWLLSGWRPREAAFFTLFMLLVYAAFILYALSQHHTDISCGCYAFGHDRRVSPSLLARNAAAGLVALVPLFGSDSARGAVEWTFTVFAALSLLTLLALMDELTTIADMQRV